MSAQIIICNFSRESFCATCLSQNGKLIALRLSQASILSYSEINLKPTDRICRLCLDFVQAIALFKSRAVKAQAWLQSMASRQQERLHCVSPLSPTLDSPVVNPLSSLDMKPEPPDIVDEDKNILSDDGDSSSHFQNVSDCVSQQIHSDATIPGSISAAMIKHEIEDNTETNNSLHQNMVYTMDCQKQGSNSFNTVNVTQRPSHIAMPTPLKEETNENDDISNDSSREKNPLSLGMVPESYQLSHCNYFGSEPVAMPLMKTVSGNVEAYKNKSMVTSTSHQIENNVEASVISKRQSIKLETVKNNCKNALESRPSVEIRVFTHQEVNPLPVRVKKAKKTSTTQPQPAYIYTETIMTEEEMTQWRLMKPTTEFYSRGLPSERCEKCIEPFDHRVKMRAHARNHTEALGVLECDICQQRMVDKPTMEVHRKWHYRLLKCRYCPFVWDDVNTVRRHCREMHNVPQVMWDCDRCERRFPSVQLWRRHVRYHERARCPICGACLLKQCLKKHMMLHTGEVPLKTCGECGKQYRGEAGLKSHMRTHRTEVTLHFARGLVPLKTCKECGKQYRGVSGLRSHMKTHRTKIDEAAYCVECGVQFRSQMSYRSHLKTGRHIGEDEFRFECDHCDKKFPSLSKIRYHMDVHSDTKYPCVKCKQVFNTARCLKRHIRLLHEGRKRREHACDQCGKKYTLKQLLKDHMNTHTGARPYVCKICGDTFGYKAALYTHTKFKHKTRKKTDKINGKKKINIKKTKTKRRVSASDTRNKLKTLKKRA